MKNKVKLVSFLFLIFLFSSNSFAHTTLGILKGKNLISSKAIQKGTIRVKYYGEVYRKFFTDIPGYEPYKLTQMEDNEIIEIAIKKAILSWVNAIREISPIELAREVIFVDSNYDLAFHFNDSNKSSFFNPLNGKITINGKYIAHHRYATILHEVGHAFGLGDIGVGVGFRTSDHMSGPAVMRIPNSKVQLRQDDINGVRFHFCSMSSYCDPVQYPTYTMEEYVDSEFWKKSEEMIADVFKGDYDKELYKFFYEGPAGPAKMAKSETLSRKILNIFDRSDCQEELLSYYCQSSVSKELKKLKVD